MAIRSTRLKCSTHKVWLVLDVQIVNKASGPVRIEYWKCPLDCGYVRSNKYQAKPVKKRVAATSHRSLKKKAHDPVSEFDRQYFLNF